ncbi:hypothetical protein Tco_0606428 [Tanacetum coccineum]
MDGGEDGDDDDDDSSGYDVDDEDEENKEEEEEHLVPADSAIIVPTASISLPPKAEVERLLAMPTPPPSPLTSLSPPSAGERLARCMASYAHSSPPPVSSPLLPSFGFTAALPSPPLPPLLPSLYIPPPVNRRDDIPESELPHRKRLCLSTLGSSTIDAEARRRGIREVRYGIRETWVDPVEAVPEIAPMILGVVNTRVTELTELHEHDTQDLYALLEDAQDGRTRISQRVTRDSQRVDLLMEDRIALQETVLIVEEEAYASREAWAHSIGLGQVVHYELQTHREQVHETRSQMQQANMAELRETDHRRQTHMVETLLMMQDMRQEMGNMQAELLALREKQRRAGQPGSDARVPDHQETSRDADSRT